MQMTLRDGDLIQDLGYQADYGVRHFEAHVMVDGILAGGMSTILNMCMPATLRM